MDTDPGVEKCKVKVPMDPNLSDLDPDFPYDPRAKNKADEAGYGSAPLTNQTTKKL